MDGSVFRMQLVTIALKTLKTTIITPTPIYNNSREYDGAVTYDSINNILYFFSVQGYLEYPVFLTYKIPSFTEEVTEDSINDGFNYAPRRLYSPATTPTAVFPIILLNYSEIFTLSFSPTNGNLYSIVMTSEGDRLLAGVMDPTTSLMEIDDGDTYGLEVYRTGSTFDPISNELVFCLLDGRNSYALVSYNVATQTWYADDTIPYDCKLLPFKFIYSK